MDNNLNSSPASPLASGPTTERKAWFIALGVIVLFLVLIFVAAIWSSKKFGSGEGLSETDKLQILKQLEADSAQNTTLDESNKKAIVDSLEGEGSVELSDTQRADIVKKLEQN